MAAPLTKTVILSLLLLQTCLAYNKTILFDFDSGLPPGWTNGANGNLAFTHTSGSTPSSSTGPSAGVGGTGSYYYAETSSPVDHLDLFSLAYNGSYACADLPVAAVDFYYNMYGSDVDLLKVVDDGDRTLWSLFGDQGKQWTAVSIIDIYATGFRFEYVAGPGFRSDAAIDQVTVSCGQASPPSPPIAPSPSLPPSAPDSPSLPPMPPAAPGSLYISTVTSLVAALSNNSTERLVLIAARYELGGAALAVPPGRRVTIEGGGATVDGEHLSSLFHVGSNAMLELRGLHLQSASDSAVRAESGANVSIANAVVRGCHASSGGVVHLDNAILHMKDVAVFDSSANSYGGVVYASSSSTVTIESLTATNTTANEGGGVVYALSSTVTIGRLDANKTFAGVHVDNFDIDDYDYDSNSDPSAASFGAVVYASSSTVTIQSLVATGSSCSHSGGVVYAESSSSVTIGSLDATGTSANYDGGVIYAKSSAVTIGRLDATDTSANDKGGVIDASSSSTITINSLTATGTSATENGGVVSAKSSTINITSLTATSTYALNRDGGVVFASKSTVTLGTITASNTLAGNDGGVIEGFSNSYVAIESIIATKTSAKYGGVVYGASTAFITIGSIIATDTFATREGGVVHSLYDQTIITIESLTAIATYAMLNGGVVGANFGGSVNIGSLNASNTYADYDGGVVSTRSNSDGLVTVGSLTATGTYANRRGGVVCSSGDDKVTLESLTAINTYAKTEGGVVRVDSGIIAIGRITAINTSVVSGSAPLNAADYDYDYDTSSGSSPLAGGVIFATGSSAKVILGTSHSLGSSSMHGSSAPAGAAIWLHSGAKLEATSLHIEHICSTGTTAIVHQHGSGSPLPIRDLRIGLLGCNGNEPPALVGFGTSSFLTCSDHTFTTLAGVEEDICSNREGIACTDSPIAPGSSSTLTTPSCTCVTGYLPNRDATSPQMAAYSSLITAGCVRPIKLDNLFNMQNVEVVVPLTKDLAQPTAASEEIELTMSFNGTDWHVDYVHIWRIPPSTVSWLHPVNAHGNISTPEVHLPLLVSASGLPDKFNEVYDVVVTTTFHRRGVVTEQSLSMPVRIVVTALVAPEECTLSSPSVHPIIGEPATFVFTARDVDGLPLQANGFTPVLTIDGEDHTGSVTMQYTGGARGGEYAVQLIPSRLGVHTLRVLHNDGTLPHAKTSFTPTLGGGTGSVTTAFTLSGDVSDYDISKQAMIREAIAEAANVQPTDVSISLSPGSVKVTALIIVSDQATASTAAATLSGGILADAQALESALQSQGLTDTTVSQINDPPAGTSTSTGGSTSSAALLIAGWVLFGITAVLVAFLVYKNYRLSSKANVAMLREYTPKNADLQMHSPKTPEIQMWKA